MRRETFHTPGTLTLDLRVPSGEIAIESVDGAETTVELDATGASDAVRELLDSARIELRQRGDGHEVIVDVPHRRRGLGLIFDRGDFRRACWLRTEDVRCRRPRLTLMAAAAGGLRADLASGDLRFAELRVRRGEERERRRRPRARLGSAKVSTRFRRRANQLRRGEATFSQRPATSLSTRRTRRSR
jgi:hypothetical protein